MEFPKAALIKGLDVIVPGEEDYDESFKIAVLLLKSGTPVPAVDIIVAATTLNRDMTLHTRDKHFEVIQRIRQDLKVVFK